MRYDFKTCPRCGASLDVGEICSCIEEEAQAPKMAAPRVQEDPAEASAVKERPGSVQFCKYPERKSCRGCHHLTTSWLGYTGCDMQTEQERIDWICESYRRKFAINAS